MASRSYRRQDPSGKPRISYLHVSYPTDGSPDPPHRLRHDCDQPPHKQRQGYGERQTSKESNWIWGRVFVVTLLIHDRPRNVYVAIPCRTPPAPGGVRTRHGPPCQRLWLSHLTSERRSPDQPRPPRADTSLGFSPLAWPHTATHPPTRDYLQLTLQALRSQLRHSP